MLDGVEIGGGSGGGVAARYAHTCDIFIDSKFLLSIVQLTLIMNICHQIFFLTEKHMRTW